MVRRGPGGGTRAASRAQHVFKRSGGSAWYSASLRSAAAFIAETASSVAELPPEPPPRSPLPTVDYIDADSAMAPLADPSMHAPVCARSFAGQLLRQPRKQFRPTQRGGHMVATLDGGFGARHSPHA